MTLSDVDAIAVSAGPGLAGCLAVGVSGAKSLAWAANKPIYGINHVIGAYCGHTVCSSARSPNDTLALIVSGGHTSLLHVEDVARHIDVVGTTLDDAAGECLRQGRSPASVSPIRADRISIVMRSWATRMPYKVAAGTHPRQSGPAASVRFQFLRREDGRGALDRTAAGGRQ